MLPFSSFLHLYRHGKWFQWKYDMTSIDPFGFTQHGQQVMYQQVFGFPPNFINYTHSEIEGTPRFSPVLVSLILYEVTMTSQV